MAALDGRSPRSTPPELLRAVFRQMGDAAMLTRFPERVVADVNPAFVRLFGYEPHEIVGRSTEIIHLDRAHYERFGERLREEWAKEDAARIVWPFRRKDGREITTDCTISAVQTVDGEPVGVVSIVRALSVEQEEHARFRLLAEHASDVVTFADPSGTLVHVSPSVGPILGYEPSELLGAPGQSLAHPDDVAALRDRWPQGPPDEWTWEHRALRRDGAWIWLECRIRRVRDEAGRDLGWLTMARDVTQRREAERAVALSEARWRSLVENAPDYVYTVDREGRILFLNRDAPGRPRDAIVGTLAYAWSEPDDRDRVREAYRRAFEEGVVTMVTTRTRRASGELRVYETRISPVWQDGGVSSATVVSRDITDRERLEDALARSEAKLRHLSDAGILGVAMGDFSGRILEANDAFLAAIGHPRAALETGALRWDAITPPEWHERDAQAVRELLERGAVSPYEKEYVRADGGRARVLVGVAMLDAVAGLSIAFALDVSGWRRAEAEVESQRRLAETILDAQAELGEGIALVGEDGRLVHINRALARITGYTMEELVALPNPIAAVTAPEAAPTWAARFAALARGEPVEPRFESFIRRKDGASLPVEIVGINVPYQGKRCRLYVLRDLSAQRDQQRQLEATRQALAQAEKLAALGTLVSGVAHEARTPMTAMMNASHLLQSRIARGGADPSLAPLLETIVESAARLNGFIDELRRFTRMRHVERAPLRLDDPVREALRLFAQTHPAHAPIEARLAEAPPVRANAARLVQVVLNLVENAADATGGKGRVVVSTGPSAEGGAVLLVEDDGHGADASVRAHMFDPLFTTKPHGTGLGLAIVRRIAEEHEARIDVDTAPGKGMRMRLVFPPA